MSHAQYTWSCFLEVCPFFVTHITQKFCRSGIFKDHSIVLNLTTWSPFVPYHWRCMPHWNLRFQNKKLTYCTKLSKFWAPGGPAGQCCLIGSLIWKCQKFCSQYWIDYSRLTINYSFMFDFNSLTETLHLEFTDCRKIVELSWLTHVWLNQVTCLDF